MTADCTASEEEYICPAGFLCGWPAGVELAAGLPERPGSWQKQFLQAPKDVTVRDVLIHTTHYRFYDDAIYKSTFTFLLIDSQTHNDGICCASVASRHFCRSS